MDNTIRPPGPLSNKGNMAENWKTWKKDFIVFMELSNYIDKSQDIKAYLLRNYIGEVGQNAIQKLVFENESDRDNMFKLIQKLDAHFNPINEVVVRYQFFSRFQKQNESIEDYINDLKIKAAPCNFGKLTNSLIRDKVIANLKDNALRKKLFEVKNLDLPKLISVHNEYMATIAEKNQSSLENTKPVERKQNICWRCKQRHPMKRCPAWNSQCGNCGENHHFTHCCRKNNLLKKEQNEINKHNPKKNENNYNMGNMQRFNTTNTEGPSNMSPTAPPLPNVGNRIYPNLNDVYTPREYMRNEQRNTTQNEFLQRNETSPPAPQQHNVANMKTPGPNVNEKKKDDACILS